jgi:L-ascorbate metabolism protein UlaG (beta-lactamase superfamily)
VFLTAVDLEDVVGVIVTHEHPDHWTPEHIRRIVERNPGARVLGPQGFATAAAGGEFEVEVVHPGDTVDVEGFELRFFGGKHAVIHESIPVIDNVGVLVDGEFFYGGDSLEVPDVEVPTLAAPIGGPWQKVGEAIDYVLAVKPQRVFPVHDQPLSVAGRSSWAPRIQWAAEQVGASFHDLAPGESIDV